MEFKKRKLVSNGTGFKVEYTEGDYKLKTKEFNSIKSMEQWIDRQTDFSFLENFRYVLLDGKWYEYIDVKERLQTIENLEFIIKNKAKNQKPIIKELEKKNIQKLKSEGKVSSKNINN